MNLIDCYISRVPFLKLPNVTTLLQSWKSHLSQVMVQGQALSNQKDKNGLIS